MNVGYSSSVINPDTNYLLASKGVYEIAMVTSSIKSGDEHLQIYTTLPFHQTNYLGADGKGILIWKAKGSYTTEYLIVQNQVGAGSPGALINKYSAEYMSQNLEIITKNFGSNTV